MWRGLFAGLCAASACASAAGGPRATPTATVAAPPTRADPCVEEANARAARIESLARDGRLDDAWQLARGDDCPAGAGVLDEARLTLLSQMEWSAELGKVARRVADRRGGSPTKQALARRLLAEPGARVDDRALAEALVERGLAATGTERRRALDAALLAYERASGEAPRAIALRSLSVVALIDPSTLIANAMAEPEGTAHAVVVRLAGTPAKGHAVRLLGRGEYAPDVQASPAGAITVRYRGDSDALGYASPTAPAQPLPSAERYAVLRSGRVVVASSSSVAVRASVGDARVEDRKAVSLGDALPSSRTVANGRFWFACFGSASAPGGAAVVDDQVAKVSVQLDRVIGCAFDAARSQLVVLRQASETGPVVARLLALDGSADVTLPLPSVKDSASLSVTIDERRHSAAITSAGRTRYVDLVRRRLVTTPPPQRRVGPPRLAAVSVGEMGSTRAAVAPLRSLAEPPRHVVEPTFATVHSWTENGVLSPDGETVAAYTADNSYANVLLVIADAKTLKVRHRIDVPYGINWLTGYYLNDHLLVAQSYPSFLVFDVRSGEQIASLQDSEASVLVDRFLVGGSRMWDLAPGIDERLVDLGLSDDVHVSGKRPVRELTLKQGDPGKLRFADGRVTLTGMPPPRFLYCAFGEWLAPWSVCEHRLAD